MKLICSFLLALFFLRCYRRQVAVISDAEWCHEKRMNRAVDRKAELLFEYSGEFTKACGTTNDINRRNLISVEEFLVFSDIFRIRSIRFSVAVIWFLRRNERLQRLWLPVIKEWLVLIITTSPK